MSLPAAHFFTPRGASRYEPSVATVGPWASDAQHGGPPIALLTHALRTYGNDPADGRDAPTGARRLARLTVEILGPVPLSPCEITVDVERPGKRIELLKATMTSDGAPLLLARAWRLQPSAGSPVVEDDWAAPALPDEDQPMIFPGVASFPYGQSIEWRFVDGAMDRPGPATVWGRPRIPLIEGSAPDGLETLLLLLDSANGVSAELDLRRWTFVPVDLTLNVLRAPQGEWFGMAARTVIGADGIGLVHTRVFDGQGPLGRSLHTLFVRPR